VLDILLKLKLKADFYSAIKSRDSEAPTIVMFCAVVFPGATVDTKNALRTFLTSSNDFSSDGAARQRESTPAVARSSSSRVPEVTVTSATRSTPPPSSTASLRPPRDYADGAGRSASQTDSFTGHSLPTTATLQKSPRQSAPCLPTAAIFPAITDIARFSINSTGHPPLAVPFLVAPPVDQGIRGRPIFGTLAVTSVPQPSSLSSSSSISSIVLPAGFVAGSTLRLPVAPMPPAISVVTTTNSLSHGHTAQRSPIGSQTAMSNDNPSSTRAEHSDHQDVSSAMNWKLKMARDHVSSCQFLLGTFSTVML